MRLMKKISTILLTLCLVVPCFSMVVSAADGKISFSDPETKVGDTVEVKCAVRSTGVSLGEIEVVIDYDADALKFESGEGAEKSEDGKVTLTGDGGSSEEIFMIKFQALQEGETSITISEASIASSDGGELTLDEGNSKVKIGAGDPSKIKNEDGEGDSKETTADAKDVQVEVNGVTYTLTDDFAEGDIPSGYEKKTVTLDGQERKMVANEGSGITLGYLKGDGSEDFFLFNDETATFSPYAELSISDTTSIVLLSDTTMAALPKDYAQAELTVQDKTFPVWQKAGEEDYYIIYAKNNNGETGYYRYDTVEGTYQRFEPADGAQESAKASGLMGKIQDFLGKNIQMIVLVGGLGAIAVLLLLIILGAKLHNRNAELDELYEEYGIDDEEDEPKPAKSDKEKKGGVFGRKKKEEFDDDYDDDYDDYDDDEFATESIDLDDEFATADMSYEEDEFATSDIGYEEDEFATTDMSYEEDGFETSDMSYGEDEFATADIGFDGDILDDVDADEFVVYGGESRTEELTIDDLDEVLGGKPSKKSAREQLEETFKVDFIDLD